MYNIEFTKKATKHAKLLEQVGLKDKAAELIKIIRNNPFQNPPPYEKMIGYSNRYSRRINIQHRFVYEVYKDKIIIYRMWSHYE